MKSKLMPIMLLVLLGGSSLFVEVRALGFSSLFKSPQEKAALKTQNDKIKKAEEKRKKEAAEEDKKEAVKLEAIEKMYDDAITHCFLPNFESIRKMTSGNRLMGGVIDKSGFVRQATEVIEDLKKLTPKTILKEGSRVLSKIEKMEFNTKRYMTSAYANKGIEAIVKDSSLIKDPDRLINAADYKNTMLNVGTNPAASTDKVAINKVVNMSLSTFRRVAGTHLLAICHVIYGLHILAKQIIKINEKILDKEAELLAVDQQVQAASQAGV